MFSGMKAAQKGLLFCDASNIISNATTEIKGVSQNGFQEYFQYF